MRMNDWHQMMNLAVNIRFMIHICFIRSQLRPLRHIFNIRLCECRLLRRNIHLTGCRAMTAINLIFGDMIVWLLRLQKIILGVLGVRIGRHHHLIDRIIHQMIDVALGLWDHRKWRAHTWYQSVLSISSIVRLPLILHKVMIWLLERQYLIRWCHSRTLNRDPFRYNLWIKINFICNISYSECRSRSLIYFIREQFIIFLGSLSHY